MMRRVYGNVCGALAISAVAALVGCGDVPDDPLPPPTTSRSRPLSLDYGDLGSFFPEKVPVGLFDGELGYCTAFLVKPGFVVTAGHCVQRKTGRLRKSRIGNAKVCFAERGGTEAECHAVTEARLSEVADPTATSHNDFAFLLVENMQDLIERRGAIEVWGEPMPYASLVKGLEADLISIDSPDGRNIARVTRRPLEASFDIELFRSEFMVKLRDEFPDEPAADFFRRFNAALPVYVETRYARTPVMFRHRGEVSDGHSGGVILHAGRAIGIAIESNADQCLNQWLPGVVASYPDLANGPTRAFESPSRGPSESTPSESGSSG